MRLFYIRFGQIPENEMSKIYCGEQLVGYESGVSVYEAIENNDRIQILIPTIKYSSCVSLSGCIERDAFEVIGDVVGNGSDGEPLLKNVKIIRELGVLLEGD